MTRFAPLAALVALCALPLATPARAQTPLTADQFERYVEGKTLYFGLFGQPYGAERYRSDRRVEWSFLDGKCKEGHWFEMDGQICYDYDDGQPPQCWTFFMEEDKLRAIFENDPSAPIFYETYREDAPLMCHGPEVGV